MKASGYCLYCFHQELDEHSRCTECGRTSLPSQRAEYWNQSPGLVRTARLVKLLVTLLGLFGMLLFFGLTSPNTGPGAGWLILFPLSFAMAGRKTSEKWTRHLPYFNAQLVWSTVLVLIGLAFGLLVVITGEGSADSLAWGGGFLVAGLGLAFVVRLLCARCERWKRDQMSGVRRLPR